MTEKGPCPDTERGGGASKAGALYTQDAVPVNTQPIIEIDLTSYPLCYYQLHCA